MLSLSLEKNINKSLNPAFRLLKPTRTDIEDFRSDLKRYFDCIDSQESEENLKTHLMDLFKKRYVSEHLIEQQEKIDFVIRKGMKGTNASVLFESKKSSNKGEMITNENLNKKALHEIILYYMRERDKGNDDIRHVVICNEFEFYIFEAKEFERNFYKNAKFKKDFIEWQDKQKSDDTTDFFYNSIAKPFIDKMDGSIFATYLNLKDYKNSLSKDEKKIISLFKILSPEHLLKKSFANDNNSLNKNFYDELLYLIGLSEEKDGSKQIITRLGKEKRNQASLIENTISKLIDEADIDSKEIIALYGANRDERLFNISLELNITWINRLLFLKLLESQIFKYQNKDKGYKFLDFTSVDSFDTLEDLFFRVLAKPHEERQEHIKEKYHNVPYLNSSLFEKTPLEKIISIGGLNDNLYMPLFSKSVLRNSKSQKNDDLKIIDYIFRFLDAYDFASEGEEEIQEQRKTLINASVLGLIFEKINGYKDGSIFTPSYITQFMSKKVIEKTIIEKFSKEYPKWKITSLDDLVNYLIDHRTKEKIIEFNNIVNSIKICDPAVGSGHFLVSCLNELIAIKSKLGILADNQGNRIADFETQVDNDELIITHTDTGEIFTYSVNNGKISKSAQFIQKTLFEEKQTLIENCLFGVDINPNSVKICCLRLWIELLKNAYYTEESNFTKLETLPNIDINIKQGNSLLSRFTLTENLSVALEKANITVKEYKSLISDYKNSKDRNAKRILLEKIDEIKSHFKKEILSNLTTDISKKIEQLKIIEGQSDLFGLEEDSKKKKQKNISEQKKEIERLQNRKDAFLTNNTFINALEWRFEFPEVLDEKGKFIGFDIIIANPPYMRIQDIEATQPQQKTRYEEKFRTAKGSYDLANLFFELALDLGKTDCNNIFIFPHKFFNSNNGEALREYLLQSKCMKMISHFGANMVFENATTYTCIALFNKTPSDGFEFQRFKLGSPFKEDMLDKSKYQRISYNSIESAKKLYGGNPWIFFDEPDGFKAFQKIYQQTSKVGDKFSKVFQGIPTSKDSLYIAKKIAETDNTYTILVNPNSKVEKPAIETKSFIVEKTLFKPFLMGKDVHRYDTLKTDKLVFFPYDLEGKATLVTLTQLKEKYPQTYDYVMFYEAVFKAREDNKAGKLENWHSYLRVQNLDAFEQEKLSSMEICAKYPHVTLNNQNIYHTTKVYSWVKAQNVKESYLYFLAILNSSLLWWFLKHTGDTLQSDTRTMKTDYLNPFPLPQSPTAEQELELITLSKEVMDMKASNSKADTSAIENEINNKVFELYGLTEEEKQAIKNSL